MKNARKILVVLVAAAMVFCMMAPVYAADENPAGIKQDGAPETNGEIIVNGELIEAPEPSVDGDEGVIMLPLIPIAEALGIEVVWDEEAESALIGGDICIWIGEAHYTVDGGDPIEFGPAPVLIDDDIYVPISFFKLVIKGYDAYVSDTGAVVIEALQDNPFADVAADAWYYDAVMYIFGKKLMLGTAGDAFSPGGTLTRGMIVTILGRYADAEKVTSASPFTDVADDAYYAPYVYWAQENGIVLGYGDGKFGPGDPVTKEQLALLIYRLQEFTGEIPPDILMDYEYPDWDKINDWAKEAVNVLTIQGIFRDIPGADFNPQTPATRAEVASMLYRYITALDTPAAE